jgi:hypothetical protein
MIPGALNDLSLSSRSPPFAAVACRLSSPAPAAFQPTPAVYHPRRLSPAVYHPRRPPLFSRRLPFIIPGARLFSAVDAVYHPRRLPLFSRRLPIIIPICCRFAHLSLETFTRTLALI